MSRVVSEFSISENKILLTKPFWHLPNQPCRLGGPVLRSLNVSASSTPPTFHNEQDQLVDAIGKKQCFCCKQSDKMKQRGGQEFKDTCG